MSQEDHPSINMSLNARAVETDLCRPQMVPGAKPYIMPHIPQPLHGMPLIRPQVVTGSEFGNTSQILNVSQCRCGGQDGSRIPK